MSFLKFLHAMPAAYRVFKAIEPEIKSIEVMNDAEITVIAKRNNLEAPEPGTPDYPMWRKYMIEVVKAATFGDAKRFEQLVPVVKFCAAPLEMQKLTSLELVTATMELITAAMEATTPFYAERFIDRLETATKMIAPNDPFATVMGIQELMRIMSELEQAGFHSQRRRQRQRPHKTMVPVPLDRRKTRAPDRPFQAQRS